MKAGKDKSSAPAALNCILLPPVRNIPIMNTAADAAPLTSRKSSALLFPINAVIGRYRLISDTGNSHFEMLSLPSASDTTVKIHSATPIRRLRSSLMPMLQKAATQNAAHVTAESSMRSLLCSFLNCIAAVQRNAAAPTAPRAVIQRVSAAVMTGMSSAGKRIIRFLRMPLPKNTAAAVTMPYTDAVIVADISASVMYFLTGTMSSRSAAGSAHALTLPSESAAVTIRQTNSAAVHTGGADTNSISPKYRQKTISEPKPNMKSTSLLCLMTILRTMK